jgi:LPXTG-site transpeptidase (sortase) family protein
LKTSALIIASFAVGALVTLALAQKPDAAVTRPVDHPVAHREPAQVTPTIRPTPAPTPSRHQGAARINIPRLHLRATVGRSLDQGPAWWPVTGRPGGGDTIAIAGHRTTHSHPFLNLDRLEPGDVIYVRWQGIAHRYVMSGRRIVSQKQLHIADARGHELLLLTACTPKGSSRQRIVIYAWPDTKHPSS